MKTYSIGRDLNCDIVINDTTDVISRRHALLNVTSSGKMTIIDQSSNGTYVNGIRISQNVPVPITRKDTISLAHVAKLDWNRVPKENKWVLYIISVAVILAVIAGFVFGMNKFKNNHNSDDNALIPIDTVRVDSTDIKRKEIERRDSVEKAALRDSIKMLEAEKARQDSISRAKAKAKTQESKKKQETKTEESDKSSKPNKKKTIG